MSGLVGVVVVGSWLSLIVAIGVLCYRLLRQPRQGRRSGRPTGVGLLALGAVVGGAAVAAGAVIAVVAAVDELTDVVLRWPGPRPAGELDELLHRRAAVAAAGGGVTGWGYGAAAVLYLVEMIVRQAMVFAALVAAPLIATDLRGWRRSPRRMTAVRWALTAIVIKPALTLALIVGIEVAPAGGLLALVTVAAVLVLLISAPVTMFQLLAFLDPGTSTEARAAGQRPTCSGRGGAERPEPPSRRRVCAARSCGRSPPTGWSVRAGSSGAGRGGRARRGARDRALSRGRESTHQPDCGCWRAGGPRGPLPPLPGPCPRKLCASKDEPTGPTPTNAIR